MAAIQLMWTCSITVCIREEKRILWTMEALGLQPLDNKHRLLWHDLIA